MCPTGCRDPIDGGGTERKSVHATATASVFIPSQQRMSHAKRFFGYVVGLAWLAMAGAAFRFSRDGREADHPDLAFWWAVIAVLLTVAALGAVIGTTIHLREKRDI